jgi:hypothetical protein
MLTKKIPTMWNNLFVDLAQLRKVIQSKRRFLWWEFRNKKTSLWEEVWVKITIGVVHITHSKTQIVNSSLKVEKNTCSHLVRDLQKVKMFPVEN